LSEAAIAQLRESFGSQITDSERAALDNLQGALSRTPAQRREILERTLEEIERSRERQRNLVRDITSGEYRRQRPAQPEQPAQGSTP
jgi:predicted DNA-binding protein